MSSVGAAFAGFGGCSSDSAQNSRAAVSAGPSHTVPGAPGAAKLGSRLPLGGPYERCASTSVLKSSEVLPRRRSFARQVGLLSVEVGAPCCASHPSSTGWAPTLILEAPSRVCI